MVTGRLRRAELDPASVATSLPAAYPQQEEQDNRTDDGTDKAGRVEVVDRKRVVLDQVLHEAAHERADDAKDDCAEQADRVAARNKQASDGSGNQPDNQQNNDEKSHAPRSARENPIHAWAW